jgi:predicted aspartyl protease
MVVSGQWRADDDGIHRPMVDVEVSVSGGIPVAEPFLVDTGADCSVLSESLLTSIGAAGVVERGTRIQGLAGESETVAIAATLTLKTIEGRELTIRGTFAAVTQSEALDICILGRDVLANFDVIVSRRRNEVLLIAGNHAYSVTG